jgi:hypothetical protein
VFVCYKDYIANLKNLFLKNSQSKSSKLGRIDPWAKGFQISKIILFYSMQESGYHGNQKKYEKD